MQPQIFNGLKYFVYRIAHIPFQIRFQYASSHPKHFHEPCQQSYGRDVFIKHSHSNTRDI